MNTFLSVDGTQDGLEEFSESWDQVPLRAVSADGGLFVDGDWIETKDQDPNGEIRLTQLADVGESVFLDKSDRWVNESKFEELGCTEVFPGDLLIARMPDPIARCTMMPDDLGYPAITVVDVAILRAGSDWNNRYVMWAINSQSFRNDVDSRVSGSTRQRISRSALGRTKLFRPPLETQQRIADYLDRETAEIDAAVADLDRYVELLGRRRSVLITEVVTGRIMSEWDTVPAGLVMDRYRKIAGVRSSEYKRLSLTLGGVVPRKRDDAEGLQPTNFEGYQVLPEGSLVFKLIDLENVATSRVGLSTETGLVSPAYIVVQPRSDRLFAKFGYYAFWDLYKRNYFNSMGSDGVRSALNYSDLARIRIPLPPLDEQQRIADYLDTETARIDSLIAESMKLRQLLIQRRSVLITDAVTGRKQV